MTTNVTARLTNAGCETYEDQALLTLQPPHVQPNEWDQRRYLRE